MKKHLLALMVSSITIMSCSYQYVSINSNLNQNKKSEFVIDNDTVQVRYSFSGRNCPIHIEVYNKLQKPIYVDWKNSALITNDLTFSYWTDEAAINVNVTTPSYQVRRTSNYISSTNYISSAQGSVIKRDRISFIPPQSTIAMEGLTVRSNSFNLPTETEKVSISTNGGQIIHGQKASFTKEESPLQFRSYLTLSVAESFTSSFHFDDQFWVGEIVETMASPEGITVKAANEFFVMKN